MGESIGWKKAQWVHFAHHPSSVVLCFASLVIQQKHVEPLIPPAFCLYIDYTDTTMVDFECSVQYCQLLTPTSQKLSLELILRFSFSTITNMSPCARSIH
jgi:hypothetical protein